MMQMQNEGVMVPEVRELAQAGSSFTQRHIRGKCIQHARQ